LKVIKNLNQIAPQHYKVISDMKKEKLFTDYAVIVLFVEGHPYFVKITYDMWPVYEQPINGRPTDFISGDWMATNGYKNEPTSPFGIIAAYNPLGRSRPRTEAELIAVAERAVKTLLGLTNQIQSEAGEKPIQIQFVEINYWPSSILIPAPGHFHYRAPILVKPISQRIRIAQSGLGTPSHEEAQYRGLRGAEEIKDAEKRERQGRKTNRKGLAPRRRAY
jgi:hypothetical protein